MQVDEIRQPLWRFIYATRPPDDELAYRRYYLTNDIRQIKVISYAALAFMLALNIEDIIDLDENSSLLTGIVLRFALMAFGVLMMWAMRPGISPRSVDVRVIIFSSIVAAVLVSVHMLPGISPVRMVGVGTLYIMAVHIGYPSYSRTLMFSVLIVVGGELYILYSGRRPDLAEFWLLMPIVYAFAEFIAILGSAYYHRTRYMAYRALSEVKTLSGMLPICANCKKIRDDSGYFQQIESYISEHSGVEFSHSICPDCTAELYPEMNTNRQEG